MVKDTLGIAECKLGGYSVSDSDRLIVEDNVGNIIIVIDYLK